MDQEQRLAHKRISIKRYSEQLPMIPETDCLGFDKKSIYSDLGFDKESYRAYLGSRLRSTFESCPFFRFQKTFNFS